MKVKELMECLSKIDENAEVRICSTDEISDCWDCVSGVVVTDELYSKNAENDYNAIYILT